MDANDKPVLVYSTFPSVAEAERVGGSLVDRGLAACVDIIDGMTSLYTWQGKRERSAETVMLIKTRSVWRKSSPRSASCTSTTTPPCSHCPSATVHGTHALDRRADGQAHLSIKDPRALRPSADVARRWCPET